MKTVINYLLLFLLFYSCNLKSSTKKKQSNINNFADTIKLTEEDDFKEEIYIDSIIFLIENTQYDISSFNNFRENVKFQDFIKIYTYDLKIEGTRAIIHYPIIQWKSKNGILYAENLAKYIECQFTKIVPLNTEEGLFLLLGNAKADGSCHRYYAYVIQINDDKIDLEYPAFSTRPFLCFCDGIFHYNKKKKILSFQLKNQTNHESVEDMFNNPETYGKFSKDSISGNKLYNKLGLDYINFRYFELKFDGTIFLIE